MSTRITRQNFDKMCKQYLQNYIEMSKFGPSFTFIVSQKVYEQVLEPYYREYGEKNNETLGPKIS